MKKLFTKALALIGLLMIGGGSAWAQDYVEETYDFQVWGQAHMDRNTYATINFASTSSFQVEEKDIYVISDITSTKDANVMDLNGRIAATNDITVRWGRGGSDYPRLGTENAGTKYISVVNLKAGDEVKFDNVTATFVSANVSYDNEGTPTTVANGDAVAANTVYTLTANGHVDLKVTGWGNVRQIYVKRYLTSEEVSKPSISVTGTNETSRIVTIVNGESTTGANVRTYYTTNGDTPTNLSTLYSTPINISTSCTVKAISISENGTESDVTSLDVTAGTLIKLANPSIVNNALTKEGNVYYLTYNFACDNSLVLGTPNADFTYSFNGSTPVEANSYKVTGAGRLTVTAVADGYESSSADFDVYPVVPELVADYTADDYSITGLGTGMRKWSGDSHWTFEPGKGYRACRMDGEQQKASWFQIGINGAAGFTYVHGEDEPVFLSYANNRASGNDDLRNVNYGDYVTGVYRFANVVTATVTAAGYATFSAPYALNLDAIEGGVAYVATASSAESVTIEPASGIVPANTGLIIKGEEGTCTIPVSAEAGVAPGTNLLVAVTANNTTVPAGAYVLGVDNDVVKFLITSAEHQAQLNAGKAYLAAPAGSANLRIVVGGEETGISNVTVATAAAPAKLVKNGQIVIVKNGQMFNAAGAQVK